MLSPAGPAFAPLRHRPHPLTMTTIGPRRPPPAALAPPSRFPLRMPPPWSHGRASNVARHGTAAHAPRLLAATTPAPRRHPRLLLVIATVKTRGQPATSQTLRPHSFLAWARSAKYALPYAFQSSRTARRCARTLLWPASNSTPCPRTDSPPLVLTARPLFLWPSQPPRYSSRRNATPDAPAKIWGCRLGGDCLQPSGRHGAPPIHPRPHVDGTALPTRPSLALSAAPDPRGASSAHIGAQSAGCAHCLWRRPRPHRQVSPVVPSAMRVRRMLRSLLVKERLALLYPVPRGARCDLHPTRSFGGRLRCEASPHHCASPSISRRDA